MRDPFYTAMPGFFGMTMNELLAAKHPDSWLLFERGFIDEDQLLDEFFLDGRDFNKRGLVDYMVRIWKKNEKKSVNEWSSSMAKDHRHVKMDAELIILLNRYSN